MSCLTEAFDLKTVFIFSMPSKVIIVIVIKFMFLDINMFRARRRAHFNPRAAARAIMNIFMHGNIKSII